MLVVLEILSGLESILDFFALLDGFIRLNEIVQFIGDNLFIELFVIFEVLFDKVELKNNKENFFCYDFFVVLSGF